MSGPPKGGAGAFITGPTGDVELKEGQRATKGFWPKVGGTEGPPRLPKVGGTPRLPKVETEDPLPKVGVPLSGRAESWNMSARSTRRY